MIIASAGTLSAYEEDGENTRLLQCMDPMHHLIPQAADTSAGKFRTMSRYRILVDILIAMFGISAWIGINGIFVQLPLLVESAPEGWSLPAYIVIVVQAANMGPLLYGLIRKFAPGLCNESIWISSLLILGTIAMGFLAFLYDTSTEINGVDHSVALLVFVFATALVGCSSSVLFLPYLRNFDEVHLVYFFIGEGLSGLLPSGVALVQGVGGSPVCPNNSTNSTSAESPLVLVPKFSPRVYFLMLLTILALSTSAFWLLEHLPVGKKRLDHQTIKTLTYEKIAVPRTSASTFSDTTEVTQTTEIQMDPPILSTITRSYLYMLIGLVCLGGNGFLPGIQSYSCLPYGHLAYHLTVTMANLANPVACVMALWFPEPGPRGITVVTGLAVVVATHVTWLAFLSPVPPLRDTTLGVVHVVIAWILLTGFVTYAKLSITAIFRREPGDRGLFYAGVFTQTGSATGALVSFVLTSYSNLLVSYNACKEEL